MSDHASPATPPSVSAATSSAHSLTIRIWPNIPILYPMAIAALLCGICSLLFGMDRELTRLSTAVPSAPVAQSAPAVAGSTVAAAPAVVTADPADIARRIRAEQVIALIFLAAFAYTMVVICTDIVLTWALLGLFLGLIVALVLFILNIYHGFLPGLFGFLNKFVPLANAQFYFAIFGIWALLMVAAVIYSRFHYVRIESNEVILVGGVLDKRKRLSSMRMQYTKEICDIFEYYLPFVRSGRLILRFPQESEPVIIDHVINIDKVVEKLAVVSSTLLVAPDDHQHPA